MNHSVTEHEKLRNRRHACHSVDLRETGFVTKDCLLNEVVQQIASGSDQYLMLYNTVDKNTMHLATHTVLYIEKGCCFFFFLKLILASISLYFLTCNLFILTFTQATIYTSWRWWPRTHLQDAFFYNTRTT